MTTEDTLTVKSLGNCHIDSPIREMIESRNTSAHYVDVEDRVFFYDTKHL